MTATKAWIEGAAVAKKHVQIVADLCAVTEPQQVRPQILSVIIHGACKTS